MINYKEKVEEIKNNPTWFKPDAGVHKIEFLEEPQSSMKTYNGEEREVYTLYIKANGEPFVWDISPGKTINSVYGQLMLIGAVDGFLKGKTVTLLVKSDTDKNGKAKKNYTITEALDLMPKDIKPNA